MLNYTLRAVSKYGRLRHGRTTGPRLLLGSRNGLLEGARFADVALRWPLQLALLNLLLNDAQLGQLLPLLLLQLELDVDARTGAAFVLTRAGTWKRPLPERLCHFPVASAPAASQADRRHDGNRRRNKRRRLLLLAHHSRVEATVEDTWHVRLTLGAVNGVPVLFHERPAILKTTRQIIAHGVEITN